MDELVRQDARQVIQQAIEAKLTALLDLFENVKMLHGQRAVVRNGHLPEREALTAIGPVAVKVLKVRDRSGSRMKFNSLIVPPHVRKSPHVSAALPWLYLKGSEAICGAVRRPDRRLDAGMSVDQLAVLLSLHRAREPAVRSAYGIWHRLSGRDPESGADVVFPVDQRPRAIAGRLRRCVRYAWGTGSPGAQKSCVFSRDHATP
jgi:hypothetical protein